MLISPVIQQLCQTVFRGLMKTSDLCHCIKVMKKHKLISTNVLFREGIYRILK